MHNLIQVVTRGLWDLHLVFNEVLWGPPLIMLILGTGIYLSFYTGFIQIVRLPRVFAIIGESFARGKQGQGDISPFQALTTALAATVGTGNIAGVATALTLGGPGAIFWMWFSAFFGMVVKYSEIVLSVHFRLPGGPRGISGGPMYALHRGLGSPWLAGFFAVSGVLASFGIGGMVQANSLAGSAREALGIPPLWSGILVTVAVALVVLGGIKGIGTITEKLVPLMAFFYVAGALVIIFTYRADIPGVLASIFSLAFTPGAAAGGAAGAGMQAALRYGVARGIFSNEAGMGSAAIAHASAATRHPVQQGVWGIIEVMVDTLVICTLTALVILVTGVKGAGLDGAALTTEAFNRGLPGPGGLIVALGMIFFAFTTVLAWSFYGEKCVEYLLGTRATYIYRLVWLPFLIVGAVGGLRGTWALADTFNGLMVIPNLVGLLGLRGLILKLTREYLG